MSRYAEKLAEIWVRAAPMWLAVQTKSGEGERKWVQCMVGNMLEFLEILGFCLIIFQYFKNFVALICFFNVDLAKLKKHW
jgi:hypothetical protein